MIIVAQISNLLSKYLPKSKRYEYQKSNRKFEKMCDKSKYGSDKDQIVINDES